MTCSSPQPLFFWLRNVKGCDLGCPPLPVIVSSRTITCSVGDPYKPSFTTAAGRGPHPRCDTVHSLDVCVCCGFTIGPGGRSVNMMLPLSNYVKEVSCHSVG